MRLKLGLHDWRWMSHFHINFKSSYAASLWVTVRIQYGRSIRDALGMENAFMVTMFISLSGENNIMTAPKRNIICYLIFTLLTLLRCEFYWVCCILHIISGWYLFRKSVRARHVFLVLNSSLLEWALKDVIVVLS